VDWTTPSRTLFLRANNIKAKALENKDKIANQASDTPNYFEWIKATGALELKQCKGSNNDCYTLTADSCELKGRLITCNGNVRLTSKQNSIEGDLGVFNFDTEVFEMQSSKKEPDKPVIATIAQTNLTNDGDEDE
jgi:lipopolysaccharide export system protein LptA